MKSLNPYWKDEEQETPPNSRDFNPERDSDNGERIPDGWTPGTPKDMRLAEMLQAYSDSYEKVMYVVERSLKRQIQLFSLPNEVIPTFVQRGVELANDTALKTAITVEANKDNLLVKSLDSTANGIGMVTQGTGVLNGSYMTLFFTLLDSVIKKSGLDLVLPETPPETPPDDPNKPSTRTSLVEILAKIEGMRSSPNQTQNIDMPQMEELVSRLVGEALTQDLNEKIDNLMNEKIRESDSRYRIKVPKGEQLPSAIMEDLKHTKARWNQNELLGLITALIADLRGLSDADKQVLMPNLADLNIDEDFLRGRRLAQRLIKSAYQK